MDDIYAEVLDGFDEFRQEFLAKAEDYKGNFTFLGSRGQVQDILRKAFKLKTAILDEQEMNFEGAEDMARDLIGHSLMLIYMLQHPEKEGTLS